MGHDTPASLFTDEMSKLCRPDERLAFFLGGVGDARHFYYTLTLFYSTEHPKKTKRKIHFTFNDILPAVFARNLVFFVLFDELSYMINTMPRNKEMQLDREKKTATLFFLYLGQLVPAYVNEELQRVILKIISMLEGDEKLPSWIHMSSDMCNAILPLLRSWQSDVFKLYSTRRIQVKAKNDAQQSRVSISSLVHQMGLLGAPNQYESKEEKDYLKTIMIPPPQSLNEAYEPELGKLLDLPRSESKFKSIEQYISKNWKINATMFDVAGEKSGLIGNRGENPYEFGKDVIMSFGLSRDLNRNPRLYDSANIFFISTAKALAEIRDRIFVEPLIGDATELLEGIRAGLVKNREPKWPVQYDHVHLSNVPDYVGGSAASFLYGVPILTSKPYAWYSSVCLRNPSIFKSYDIFNCEYLCLPDWKTARKIFPYKGTCLDDPEIEGVLGGLDPRPPMESDYWSWSRISKSPLQFSELLSRDKIENWLYQLFLKTTLPVPRERYSHSQIYSPQNLTFIFRIVIHLHQTGYPAHWLAHALETLLANAVETSARPAHECPLTPSALSKRHPVRRANVAPFLAEFRTLAAQWAKVLPFGLQSTHIPPAGRVRRYILNAFPVTAVEKDSFGRVPAFVLVFWDEKALEPGALIWEMDLRKILLPDEKGAREAAAVRMREKGLCVVTVWKFDPVRDEASFWMDEDVVKKWKQGSWNAQIWRDDSYTSVSPPVPVAMVPGSAMTPPSYHSSNGLSEGEYWSG